MSPQPELIFALDEEIGHPDLFTGRKKELAYFLDWCKGVENKLSQSTAILARRKRGKTALIQRLYNILWTANNPKAIPFFFRPAEINTPLLAFSSIFYSSLILQYFAFKLRNPTLVDTTSSIQRLKVLAENDPIISRDIETFENIYQSDDAVKTWEYVRHAGHRISQLKDERIIQIIDEFQYLDEYI